MSPPTDRYMRCAPDQRMLSATAIARIGSNGSQPVMSTRHRPPTTPTLVQQSVSTCLPLASRMIEPVRRPVRTRYQPERAVDDGGRQHEQHAGAEALDLEAVQPLVHGGPDDGDGRQDDQRAFEAGGEERDALVAVREPPVGRLRAQVEAEGRERRRRARG